MEIIDGYLWVTYTDSEDPVNIGQVSAGTSGGDAVISGSYTDGLAFYPLGDGSEYGVMIGNAIYMKNIVIPESYNGKPVTTILPFAFQGSSAENATLESVEIPSSITKIGEWAFANCTSLTSITVPSSVVEVGECAFYGIAEVIIDSTSREGDMWTIDWLGCMSISWKE